MRKLAMSVVSSLFVVATGCGAADSTPPDQAGAEPEAHVHLQKGHGGGGGSGTAPLVDHGGKILPASNVYTIWWGTPSAFPADAQAGIDALFSGMNGSHLVSIADQYMRGAAMSTEYVASNWVDTSAPPSRSPATSAIAAEACKVLTANGATPDPNGIYFVYTSNFPGRANFCAWHSYGTCNGVTIQVGYMPNTTGLPGCDPGNLYNCNSYSQGTRSLANVSSHEYMEALTDATASAWYDGSGSEIGDKCAWQFSSCETLGGGSWQLQEEWSKAANGCAQ